MSNDPTISPKRGAGKALTTSPGATWSGIKTLFFEEGDGFTSRGSVLLVPADIPDGSLTEDQLMRCLSELEWQTPGLKDNDLARRLAACIDEVVKDKPAKLDVVDHRLDAVVPKLLDLIGNEKVSHERVCIDLGRALFVLTGRTALWSTPAAAVDMVNEILEGAAKEQLEAEPHGRIPRPYESDELLRMAKNFAAELPDLWTAPAGYVFSWHFGSEKLSPVAVRKNILAYLEEQTIWDQRCSPARRITPEPNMVEKVFKLLGSLVLTSGRSTAPTPATEPPAWPRRRRPRPKPNRCRAPSRRLKLHPRLKRSAATPPTPASS
jgi:hypothetical protein